MNIQSLVATEGARGGFYPTPPGMSERLLAGINWDMVQEVLEPSAGKGNIVRAIAENYSILRRYGDHKIHIDCVEIDPHLRSIIQYEFCGQRGREISNRLEYFREKQRYNYEKKCSGELTPEEKREERALSKDQRVLDSMDLHIIHNDFLTFDSRKRYDLIAMNPPFSDGDAHLLKAIVLQSRSGGQIRCILNAETVRNPYTNRRRFLVNKLHELNAKIEYIDGAFSDSERHTDVSVALIKIDIPKPKQESVIFDQLRKAAQLDDAPLDDVTDMTVADFMGQIVSRFNVEVDAGIELIREYLAMKPYILEDFQAKYGNDPILSLCVGDPSRSLRSSPNINAYVRAVRGKYWRALFSNKEFVGKLTSNLRQKYQEVVGQMLDYDFTLYNIQCIAEQMNAEMGKGIQDTIVALFDKMTQEHSWYPECSKNIHYYSGWKTNKVHKINSKVILPIHGMFSDYSWSKETFNVREAENTISDIEKVFDYLDGNMTAPVNLLGALKAACEAGQTRNIHCKYFDVTLYKKGTMHIKFRNLELVERFNIYCCQKKNWLPPNYGKVTYKDMSAEEQAVVDGFHGDGSKGAGEESYQAVVSKATYFLADPVKEMPALMAPTM